MKKFLLTIVIVLTTLHFAAPTLLGFSIWQLGSAVSVSTGMSAKLACSAKYITGLSNSQIIEDLSSYSPAVRVVNLDYDNNNKIVTASLMGMAKTSAQFRSGLGCSLIMGDSNTLDNVVVPLLSTSKAKWPAGNTVETINPNIQNLVTTLVEQDNSDNLNTRAMLVIKNGEIIAQSYSDGFNETTPLLGWSMGKSVTAIMLGRMQQLDMVTMSKADLFKEWQHDDRQEITLKQLLQMSSGLTFDETYAPGSDATAMLFTAPSASNVAMQSPLTNKPGSHFSYSSGTTNILTRFMHDQMGASTQADINFLFQEIFQPLGMQNSIFETDSSGVFVGSSYIYASGQDWARLGLLMLNNGLVNYIDNKGITHQRQLLPSDWVKKASQPNSSNNDSRYGYQFWLNSGSSDNNQKNDENNQLRWPSLPLDAYAMMGNRQQSVMIIPSENTVLIRIGWTKGSYPLDKNYATILNALKG